MTTIYGLAISARATINMHSLNNEGGEGNHIQTRMVDVIGENGELYNVNAISGDMFKHIQAEHLYRLAQGMDVPLCSACARFDANRISGDPNFMRRIEAEKYSSAQVIDDMLRTCVVDDLEGNLITAGKRSVPRKSVAEFGWVVGVPEQVHTEQYFHVKYNTATRTQAEATGNAGPSDAGAEPDRSSNLGQAIFHRPASSGVYALVTNLEAARIGYNDITQRYAVDEAGSTTRLRLLLQSLLYSFVQMNGAMRNTQLPHLVNLAGVVSVSHAVLPAPTVSPLNSRYTAQIAQVATALNRLGPSLPGGTAGRDALTLHEFGSLDEFAAIMVELVATGTPYRFVERA